jgi:hypothetical protein
MQVNIGISHKIPGSKIVQNIHRGSLEYNILSTKDRLSKGNLVPELCADDLFLCVTCVSWSGTVQGLRSHTFFKPPLGMSEILYQPYKGSGGLSVGSPD